jgi:hypothetical protein
MSKKFNIFNVINFKFFLISLLIGLLFMYLDDGKRKINVYPTPSNINKIEYKDKAENCYEYELENVKCPSKKSEINHIPIQ